MGLSIRAYARHRGVSDAAVRKAIQAGRITPGPDGTIDAEHADAQWQNNTQPPRFGVQPAATPRERMETPSGDATMPAAGGSLLQARTVNEVLKAKIRQLELAEKKRERVDRAQAIAQVFQLARAERDAWLNWPSRVSSVLAAQLGVDAYTLHLLLEKAVHDHLQELGEIVPKVD